MWWSIDWSTLADPGHWFDGNPPPPSGFYAVLFLLGLAGLAAISFFYYRFMPGWQTTGVMRKLANRLISLVTPAVITLLALILIRYLQLSPFSARILLYANLLYLAGVAGYFLWYYLARFPADRREYERWRTRQQYMPRSRPRPAVTQVQSSRGRGKRRR